MMEEGDKNLSIALKDGPTLKKKNHRKLEKVRRTNKVDDPLPSGGSWLFWVRTLGTPPLSVCARPREWRNKNHDDGELR